MEMALLRERVLELHREGVDIATVGDRVTRTFLGWGITPSIAVVDCLERRRPVVGIDYSLFNMVIDVENIRGRVNIAIMDLLEDVYLHKPIVLRVSGEEDLVGIPIILFMNSGSHVYYGQPGMGVVEVLVGDDVKRFLKTLLPSGEVDEVG